MTRTRGAKRADVLTEAVATFWRGGRARITHGSHWPLRMSAMGPWRTNCVTVGHGSLLPEHAPAINHPAVALRAEHDRHSIMVFASVGP